MICWDCGTDTGTGRKTSHCRGCCRTFSTVRAFDRHRAGPISARVCLDPAEMSSLVRLDRPYECWGESGSKPHPRSERLSQSDETGSGV